MSGEEQEIDNLEDGAAQNLARDQYGGGDELREDVVPHILDGWEEEHVGGDVPPSVNTSAQSQNKSCTCVPSFHEVVGNYLPSPPMTGLDIPPNSIFEVQRDPSAFTALIDS